VIDAADALGIPFGLFYLFLLVCLRAASEMKQKINIFIRAVP
jgi:hypothetical protein